MRDAPQTLLPRHGLRCTQRRALIYEALAECATHPTAEELHRVVRARCECISLSTVYNALEAFCRCGMCRRLPTAGGGARYDADLREHLHITMTNGAVCDVPEPLGDALLGALPGGVLAEIERRTGVRIRRISIELVGEPAASENGVHARADSSAR